MKYIISEYRKDLKQMWYVCARPGWARTSTGKLIRDGSFNGGPEHTIKREHALVFSSHRSAARVANLCPKSQIQTI